MFYSFTGTGLRGFILLLDLAPAGPIPHRCTPPSGVSPLGFSLSAWYHFMAPLQERRNSSQKSPRALGERGIQ